MSKIAIFSVLVQIGPVINVVLVCAILPIIIMWFNRRIKIKWLLAIAYSWSVLLI